jgi:hypothetical protein
VGGDRTRTDPAVEISFQPGHRAYDLTILNARGEAFLATMEHREEELARFLGEGIPMDDLRTAARVVRDVRERLGSDRWREVLARTAGRPEGG